ncbi:MAG: ketoacyl-ACP synthase III [Burkholderiales bacterium]|nr:ketoacyl-ACP synthase III [Burkholderiales bacterium]
MIGIAQLASYIPEGFESNFDKKTRFGIDDAFIRDKLGIDRVSRMAAGDEPSDLCVRAFRALQQKCQADIGKVDCLVVCTQNPDGNGIPHTSAVVHGKLAAQDACAAFDIGLGCSGYVSALSIVTAFMAANGLKNGLLFTADPYSRIIDPSDKNTVLLFGDGATVTLLQPVGAGAQWVPTKFLFGTRGAQGDAINNRSGQLQMNGRAVFNFSATIVPTQIRALLEGENLTVDKVDRFLLHQGSKFIIDTLAARLGLPPEKVPNNLAAHGNTVSSSIPLLLEQVVSDAGIQTLVLSGFGVGLSWASAVLKRA